MDDRSCLCARNHPGRRVCDGPVPDAAELKDRVCVPCRAALLAIPSDAGSMAIPPLVLPVKQGE